MNAPSLRQLPRHRQAGFTIIELLVSVAVASILLFGALYSSLESFAVVQAGDTRMNTQVHARRVLERLIKDCRYASELEVTGNADEGWQIDLETGIAATPWTWEWDPDDESLSVSDGETSETIVTGLLEFTVDTQIGAGDEIEQITIVWTVREDAGGTGSGTSEATATFPASTWVRRMLP